jgi:hypothetical protein
MEPLHVYRLLLDMTSSQSLNTRIPPSIIQGYGFNKLTLMGGLPLKYLEGTLDDLIKTFLPVVPFAVLKHQGTVKLCATPEAALADCKELLMKGSNLNPEAFVLQQFLKSTTERAFFVRLHWRKDSGISARLHENERPYPAEFSQELAANYLVRAESGRSVKLSQYTKILMNSFLQLKALIQRICAEELTSISADYLQDANGSWCFMSIDSYSYSQRKAMTMRSVARPMTVSARASPKLRLIVTPPIKSVATSKSPKKSIKGLKFREMSAGRPPYLEAPKRRKELQLEELVRDIIDTRGVLKHSSYKRWLQRTSSTSNYLPIDRLFAENIAVKKKEIYRSSKLEVENLKALVRTMRKQHDSSQVINTKLIEFELGRYLLNMIVTNKSKSAMNKPKPMAAPIDFKNQMSKKVLDNGNEMIDKVRSHIRRASVSDS